MLKELADLVMLQLKTTKAYILAFLTISILNPIALVFVFGIISMKEFAPYIIAGTVTYEVSTGIMTTVIRSIGYEKSNGRFSLMIASGITKEIFAISVALSGGLLYILSIVFILLVGVYSLHLQVVSIPYLIVGVVASIFMASMFGMALGLLIKSYSAAIQYSSVISLILTFFAPVYFPITLIPLPFRYLAYLEPTTYVSQSVYNAFVGNPVSLLWSLGIVIIGVIFIIISRYTIKNV